MTPAEETRRATGPVPQKAWTIMVYMVAGNDAALDAIAVQDLREMERGIVAADEHVHIAVQINRAWPDYPQRYKVVRKAEGSSRNGAGADARRGESEFAGVDVKNKDMGKKETLTSFLEWAVAACPAKHYFLVLWGHAYGLGFGRDHNDKLTLKELAGALQKFREKRQAVHGRDAGVLEILGANACAMSYAEAAFELRDSAKYMVASQISVPFAGWPYESILRQVRQSTTDRQLGDLVVDTYVNHYNNRIHDERVSMALLDLSQAGRLKGVVDDFARGIGEEISHQAQLNNERLAFVRDVFIGAAAGDVRPLLDLHDLCQDFAEAKSESLKDAAKSVQRLLKSEQPEDKRLVLRHRCHPDLEDLNGIGIFAPFVTDPGDLKRLELVDPESEETANGSTSETEKRPTGQKEYGSLALFGGGSKWPQLVYDDLRQEIADDVMMCLSDLDVPKRADRQDITQIILAIDSAFNKLDRVLVNAKDHIDKKLSLNGYPAKDPAVTVKTFGPPWLKLIQPPDLETQVKTLQQRQLLLQLVNGTKAPTFPGVDLPTDPVGVLPNPDPELINPVIDFFANVEAAVAEVERATRRGMTNARFGVGPTSVNESATSRSFEPPKSGYGFEPPKSGYGFEPPKSGYSFEPPKSGYGDVNGGVVGGDLRVDLAFARVTELFRQVGESLQRLEAATLEAETTARATLEDAQIVHLNPPDLLRAASQEIVRTFRVLEEASTNARRTVRRVLSHPVYGLGPGPASVGLEQRQSLASAGGIDRRSLRLL